MPVTTRRSCTSSIARICRRTGAASSTTWRSPPRTCPSPSRPSNARASITNSAACPAAASGSCSSTTPAAPRSSSISTRTNRHPQATSRPDPHEPSPTKPSGLGPPSPAVRRGAGEGAERSEAGEGSLRLLRCPSAERGEPLLRVEHTGVLPRGLLEAEIEFGGAVGRLDAESGRFAAAGLVPHEIADQRVLDREDRITAQVLVAAVEDVRRDRLVTVG